MGCGEGDEQRTHRPQQLVRTCRTSCVTFPPAISMRSSSLSSSGLWSRVILTVLLPDACIEHPTPNTPTREFVQVRVWVLRPPMRAFPLQLRVRSAASGMGGGNRKTAVSVGWLTLDPALNLSAASAAPRPYLPPVVEQRVCLLDSTAPCVVELRPLHPSHVCVHRRGICPQAEQGARKREGQTQPTNS